MRPPPLPLLPPLPLTPWLLPSPLCDALMATDPLPCVRVPVVPPPVPPGLGPCDAGCAPLQLADTDDDDVVAAVGVGATIVVAVRAPLCLCNGVPDKRTDVPRSPLDNRAAALVFNILHDAPHAAHEGGEGGQLVLLALAVP